MPESLLPRLNAALEGRYALESELGAGGMATVFLANDLRHDRQVAVKVLKPELAAVIGAERFISEIKTTARLQHPHILPLFDSGAADGFLFYVMPFVEGESLRDRLDSERQLSVDEALRITMAVGGALQYAHEHDIIHRDIKPENILLHAGEPVVADFGIALAVSAAGGGRMTETGLSLGTPHYMSPEQATADRDLSARSDVYSLACVLYEMLAGDPPHTGPTSQSILMRILTEDPRPITEVRRSVPRNVAAALTKALEKLPADRFDSAEDFRKALQDEAFRYTPVAVSAAHPAAEHPPTAVHPAPDAPTAAAGGPRRITRGTVIPWSVAAVLALALGWTVLAPEPSTIAPAPVRFEMTLPAPGLDLFLLKLAISPNGDRIAYAGVGEAGVNRLFVRRADEPEFRLLDGTENATFPTFSPDGQWIAFQADGEIRKVAATGGPVLPVLSDVEGGAEPNWAEDGSIIFSGPNGIYRVSGAGGTPELLVSDSLTGVTPHHAELLPGGAGVLFTTGRIALGDPRVHVLDLRSGEVKVIAEGGTNPHYISTGHVVFGNPQAALMAIPFDLKSLEVRGTATPVLPSVRVFNGGSAQFAVSRSGTAVYSPGGTAATAALSLVTVDLDGTETTLPLPPGAVGAPRFSPDGRSVGYQENFHIWVYDLVLGSNRQFTFTRQNLYPFWSPDGEWIFYSSRGDESTTDFDTFRKRSDGSAPAEQMARWENANHVSSITPDGGTLLVRDNSNTRGRDLLTLTPPDTTPGPYLRADWNEIHGRISPDGNWVAYASDESGRYEVYVRSFPEPLTQSRISANGGTDPLWAPDGRVVYYRGEGNVIAADIGTDGGFVVTERRTLFPDRFTGNTRASYWDIDPDGSRFVMVAAPGSGSSQTSPVGGGTAATGPTLTVVVNWFEEVKARLGVAGN